MSLLLLIGTIGLLGFCLGLCAGADVVRRQVREGTVIVEGRKFLCYPSALTPERKHKH